MKTYDAQNLRIDGTFVTLDVAGMGTLTVDFALWDNLLKKIGGEQNISQVKLISNDLLEFPNDVHVEVEDFITLAKQQKVKTASFLQDVKSKYKINDR